MGGGRQAETYLERTHNVLELVQPLVIKLRLKQSSVLAPRAAAHDRALRRVYHLRHQRACRALVCRIKSRSAMDACTTRWAHAPRGIVLSASTALWLSGCATTSLRSCSRSTSFFAFLGDSFRSTYSKQSARVPPSQAAHSTYVACAGSQLPTRTTPHSPATSRWRRSTCIASSGASRTARCRWSAAAACAERRTWNGAARASRKYMRLVKSVDQACRLQSTRQWGGFRAGASASRTARAPYLEQWRGSTGPVF